jgi:hypothetical protein
MRNNFRITKQYDFVVGINMASGREKRINAGNKMARLLEAEDEDEFYKTTYGGFNEVWSLKYVVSG